MKRRSFEDLFSGEHRLYTLTEVAEVLRVSRVVLWRLCHEDRIPYVKVGRTYRITGGTLDDWIKGKLELPPVPRRYTRKTTA